MIYMLFKTEAEVNLFMRKLNYLGEGTQGKCFVDKNRKWVFKFFQSYFDTLRYDYEDLTEADILKFQKIKSNTFLFPKEIIYLNEKIIGYTIPYRNAKNMYAINPLTLNLDRLLKLLNIALKEIEYISRCGVRMYDVLYNILLGNRIYIIDTLEYGMCEGYFHDVLKENLKAFNFEIMSFLINGLFDKIIADNKTLSDMYNSKDVEVSIIDFIFELRNYLANLLGKNVTYLREAKSLQDRDVDEEKLFYNRTELIKERVIKIRSNS